MDSIVKCPRCKGLFKTSTDLSPGIELKCTSSSCGVSFTFRDDLLIRRLPYQGNTELIGQKPSNTSSSTGQKSQRLNDSTIPSKSARYPALQFIASLYRVLAVLTGLVCILLVLLHLSSGNLLFIIAYIIGGIIGVITNLAIAEGIVVFIDIEKNTRETRDYLSNPKNNVKIRPKH